MKWLLAALVVIVAALALEQGNSGSVVGSVKGVPCLRLAPDQCQRPMAGVDVRLVAEVGGAGTSTTTGQDGLFLVHLRPGKYQIQVQSVTGNHILKGPTEVTVWPFIASRADILIASGLL
jgi:hypothetical protein